MDTPTYTGSCTIGGTSQQVLLAKGSALADTLITRQSGTLILTCYQADGTTPFDLTGLSNLDAKVVPFESDEVEVTLGTGTISGAGNNIYTVTWVKDTIPAGWSTYAQDRDGAIVLFIEFEETGTADFYEVGTRFNVQDGNFSGSGGNAPLISVIYYYNPTYQYDNTTTDADPGSGKYRMDSTTLSSVTEFYVSDTTQSGVDLQTYWQGLGVGSRFYLGNPNVKLEAAYFTVSGSPVNNTDYTTVPVTFVASGTSQLTNSSMFSFTLDTVGLENSFADGSSLDDDSSNELLEFGVTASAVNHIKITNQATGSNPKSEATGDDTNVSYEMDAKGTGTIYPLKAVQFTQGADVASATALPLTNDGNYNDVTGTATITSFNSVGVGTRKTLHFDDVLTLTHHATDLILPGGANITTAAGDIGVFYEYAAGDWRCESYTKDPAISAGDITVSANNVFLGNDDGVSSSAQELTAAEARTILNVGDGADVAGPGSSTDNSFSRFDGTGGKTLQNSQTTEDDSGNVTAAGTIEASTGFLAPVQSEQSSPAAGKVLCDFDSDNDLRTKNNSGDVEYLQPAALEENNLILIERPRGASLQANSGQTGAFKITLPVYQTLAFMGFEVEIWGYTDEILEAHRVGGYNHTSGWLQSRSTTAVGKSRRFRFGNDGVNNCIVIGDISDSWNYPQIMIRNFYTRSNSQDINDLKAGWSISIETDVTTGYSYNADLYSKHANTSDLTTYLPTGTTETIDWSLGETQEIDLNSATGNVTLTFSNPIEGQEYYLKIIQGSTSRNVTFPSTVLEAGGTAPKTLTVTATNDAIDTVKMVYDGSNYLITAINQNYG